MRGIPRSPLSTIARVSPDASWQNLLMAVSADSANDIWAVGFSGTQGSDSASTSEHWDGSSGSSVTVPTPKGATATALQAVSALAPDDVWAAGYQVAASGSTVPLVEHWNGTKWTVSNALPSADDSGFAGIKAIASDDVWVSGDSFDETSGAEVALTEHWNGTHWAIMGSHPIRGSAGTDFRVLDVTPSGTPWATGEWLTSAVGFSAALAQHYGDGVWHVTHTRNPRGWFAISLFGVAAIADDDVWAVGCHGQAIFCGLGFAQRPLMEHWDGSAWSLAPVSLPKGAHVGGFDAIPADSATDMWAVGTTATAGGIETQFVMHGDGSSWTQVPMPKLGGAFYLGGVSALSASDAWIVGGTLSDPVAEHWNGTSWKSVAIGG